MSFLNVERLLTLRHFLICGEVHRILIFADKFAELCDSLQNLQHFHVRDKISSVRT